MEHSSKKFAIRGGEKARIQQGTESYPSLHCITAEVTSPIGRASTKIRPKFSLKRYNCKLFPLSQSIKYIKLKIRICWKLILLLGFYSFSLLGLLKLVSHGKWTRWATWRKPAKTWFFVDSVKKSWMFYISLLARKCKHVHILNNGDLRWGHYNFDRIDWILPKCHTL